MGFITHFPPSNSPKTNLKGFSHKKKYRHFEPKTIHFQTTIQAGSIGFSKGNPFLIKNGFPFEKPIEPAWIVV